MILRQLTKTTGFLCSAVVVPNKIKDKNEGWERVVKMFKADEFGVLSPQLTTILHTTFATAFFGACYGGIIGSREAYLSFIERNEASAFHDHFEAKKKLQDHVTLSFAKSALKWSWRTALFGGVYILTASTLTAYRGDMSISHYFLGGLLAGAIHRLNFGLRGAIAGGTIGGMIGVVAGGFTSLALKLTGSTLDDIYVIHSEAQATRDRHWNEALAKTQNSRDPLLNEMKLVGRTTE